MFGALSGVPVLLYHGLTMAGAPAVPHRERKYWVTSERFARHLDHVRARAHDVRLLGELGAPLRSPERQKRTVITFDDGNLSDHRLAFARLLARGMRAEFFVNTGIIGTRGYLDWPEVREMHAAGMSFQSHGHDHVDVTRLSDHDLESQLGDSKQRLEDRLGARVSFFAPPYGRLNRRVVNAACHAGYTGVCTSWNWPAQPGAFTLSRVAVYRGTGIADFDRLLARDPRLYAARAARAAVLFWPKSLLLRRAPRPKAMHVLEKPA